MTCAVAGCGKKPVAHGICGKHYYTWRVHGDPEYQQPTALVPNLRPSTPSHLPAPNINRLGIGE